MKLLEHTLRLLGSFTDNQSTSGVFFGSLHMTLILTFLILCALAYRILIYLAG
ncbi:hypothetical protein [Sphingobacterium sp. SYP-B4668]|uniref:hypothetical protein n=1 Tax=Sphingobacterium sp. SYP-B4668 TaxID=2996035 RepID=UPI0022DDB760|nr:hypothetical protein [Sphingobacterium sp. SYP-B4668]